MIIRLAISGNTLRLCLGLWGVFGKVFFLLSTSCKNIWGCSGVDSAFLTSSSHFVSLGYVCSGVYFPLGQPGPLRDCCGPVVPLL